MEHSSSENEFILIEKARSLGEKDAEKSSLCPRSSSFSLFSETTILLLKLLKPYKRLKTRNLFVISRWGRHGKRAHIRGDSKESTCD
jgi:hypothetical protein